MFHRHCGTAHVAGEALVAGPIAVYRLGPEGRFDLAALRGTGGLVCEVRADPGVLRSSRAGFY